MDPLGCQLLSMGILNAKMRMETVDYQATAAGQGCGQGRAVVAVATCKQGRPGQACWWVYCLAWSKGGGGSGVGMECLFAEW